MKMPYLPITHTAVHVVRRPPKLAQLPLSKIMEINEGLKKLSGENTTMTRPAHLRLQPFASLIAFIALIRAPTTASGFITPSAALSSVAISRAGSLLRQHYHPNIDCHNSHEAPSSSPMDLNTDRRSAINSMMGGIALTSLVLSTPLQPASAEGLGAVDSFADTTKTKRILITGSNSGIGLDAAQRMARRGHEVVLACVSVYSCF